MGLYINTNVTAMDALRNLGNISGTVAGDIQKLSSGLAINSAADNPSGLIISENLKAQINGLNQAVANSQDANNLIKTADGALSSVSGLLDTIRQLAVHAANTGVNDQVAVQADQQQITAAVGSIERIAENTQFGSKHLLDGTSGITASIVTPKDVAGINLGSQFNNLSTQSGTLSIQVNNVATRAVSVGNVTYATVNSSLATAGGTLVNNNGGTIVINGQSIKVSASDSVQTVLNDINNLSGSTGVSAQFSSGNGSGVIVLSQQTYGANFKISENESSNLIAGTTGTLVAGLNATVTVTAYALLNGAVTTTVSTFTGGRSSTDSGLLVSDTLGNSLLLTEGALTDATGSTVAVANVTSGSLQFQVGANAGQTVSASLGNIRTSQLGTTAVAGLNLSNIDVTTAAGASNAILVTDNAIQQVSQLRAGLGAFEAETLNPTIQYLGIGAENLSASQSQIADTNVAATVVDLTKSQIIEQAATSVLAQANSEPQNVLKLIP